MERISGKGKKKKRKRKNINVSPIGSIPYNRRQEYPRSILVTVKNARGRVLKCEYQKCINYSVVSEGD